MKIFFLLEKSCFKTVIVALCILALGLGMPRANAQVPGVIIDQDLSSDHDDAECFFAQPPMTNPMPRITKPADLIVVFIGSI